MNYIRQFDPWKGNYCTCGLKYSLAPYTGCDHRCVYCYITTYIPQAFNCRPKADFIKNLPRDLQKADNAIPISIANSSDPYPTIERKYNLMRGTLKLLSEYDFKVLLVTKSDIFLRDLDIISSNNIALTVTITTDNDELAKIIEPGAPAPSKRILAVEQLISKGIPTMVRVDPIIPELNEDVESLIKQLAEAGVKYITSSTFKARQDSLKRLIKSYPELSATLRNKYLENGEFINRSWYLSQSNREQLMRNVYECAKRYGIKFNVCREGLGLERTSPSCDGRHLLIN